MWKWLHPYAKPERAYQLCVTLQPYFLWPGILCLIAGSIWGLAFAPQDYQQGDSFRIIYIHVPSAILSMSTYVAMAVAALVGIVWQWRTAFMAMIAMAPVGAVVTFIALFTGAAWGKPMWGTWWVWDARLTSMLVLFFLYLGYIALVNAFDNPARGIKASSILVLVGFVNVPIIKFSVEWWNTLHQPASVLKIGGPSIHSSMLWPLLLMALAFTAYYLWVLLLRLRGEIIANKVRVLRLRRVHG